MENSMEVTQETKHIAAMWSSNPTPGHISRQNCNSKTYTHLYVHSSTICPSTDEQIKDMVHIYNGMLSHKKRMKWCHLQQHRWIYQVALVAMNSPTNAGDGRDAGLIPGSGRLPGEGHGNPLQYSCLENPMESEIWWAMVHGVAKSWTWLKQLSMHGWI